MFIASFPKSHEEHADSRSGKRPVHARNIKLVVKVFAVKAEHEVINRTQLSEEETLLSLLGKVTVTHDFNLLAQTGHVHGLFEICFSFIYVRLLQ